VHFISGLCTNTTSLFRTGPTREISRLMHARLKPFIIIDDGTEILDTIATYIWNEVCYK
jgi:hypothetical protein